MSRIHKTVVPKNNIKIAKTSWMALLFLTATQILQMPQIKLIPGMQRMSFQNLDKPLMLLTKLDIVKIASNIKIYCPYFFLKSTLRLHS